MSAVSQASEAHNVKRLGTCRLRVRTVSAIGKVERLLINSMTVFYLFGQDFFREITYRLSFALQFAITACNNTAFPTNALCFKIPRPTVRLLHIWVRWQSFTQQRGLFLLFAISFYKNMWSSIGYILFIVFYQQRLVNEIWIFSIRGFVRL